MVFGRFNDEAAMQRGRDAYLELSAVFAGGDRRGYLFAGPSQISDDIRGELPNASECRDRTLLEPRKTR